MKGKTTKDEYGMLVYVGPELDQKRLRDYERNTTLLLQARKLYWATFAYWKDRRGEERADRLCSDAFTRLKRRQQRPH